MLNFNQKISFGEITKVETTQLKAYAILLIVFHNLFRWIVPQTWENEFDFHKDRFSGFINFLHTQPTESINLFFSYFGHFGVQLFIILSAYGLSKSLQKSNPSWVSFMKKRYVHLYPSLVISILFLCFYSYFVYYDHILVGMGLRDVLIKLTTFSNFFPNQAMTISGPWWFYSFIFQVYAILPLLLFLYNKFSNKALIALLCFSYAFIFLLSKPLLSINLNILQTAFGHLPEVIFGIWIASQKEIKLNWWLFPMALIVFILGNIYYDVWFFSFLAAGVLQLFGFLWVIRKTKDWNLMSKIMVLIGNISLYLFATHGVIRWRFTEFANKYNDSYFTFIIAICFLTTAIFVAYALQKTENKWREYIVSSKSIFGKTIKIAIPLLLLIIVLFSLYYFDGKI